MARPYPVQLAATRKGRASKSRSRSGRLAHPFTPPQPHHRPPVRTELAVPVGRLGQEGGDVLVAESGLGVSPQDGYRRDLLGAAFGHTGRAGRGHPQSSTRRRAARHTSASIRYRTCRDRRWPAGRLGWAKSSAGSRVMPRRRITACERTLPTDVNETTWPSPTRPKASSRVAVAASVAYPWPQAERASRQPTSTAGVNGASKRGTLRPVKPMKVQVSATTTAQTPSPRRANPPSAAAAIPSLAARSRTDGKCSITTGSALRAANGSRSAGRQRRSTSRSVANELITSRPYPPRFRWEGSGHSSSDGSEPGPPVPPRRPSRPRRAQRGRVLRGR